MTFGERLRELRIAKQLSQGDIEKRTGMLRCYISRLENGHTAPSVGTRQRLARGLKVSLSRLFPEDKEPLKLSSLRKRKISREPACGSVHENARFLNRVHQLAGKVTERDRELILYMVSKMARQ